MHSYKRDTQRKRHRGGGNVTLEAEIRIMWHKPRNIWSHQKLGRARKDSPLEPSEEAWPCGLISEP